MHTLTAGNTVYTHPMAKVMISIPDDLLSRLDAQARSTRETRSGLLQRLAEEHLAGESEAKRRELEELLGPSMDFGGNAAQIIREARDSR